MTPMRERREAIGVTRQQLAEATGIPVRSIAAYESGVELPLGRAVQIALALNVPVDALVGIPRPGEGDRK